MSQRFCCKCGRMFIVPRPPAAIMFGSWSWKARLRLIWAIIRGEKAYLKAD